MLRMPSTRARTHGDMCDTTSSLLSLQWAGIFRLVPVHHANGDRSDNRHARTWSYALIGDTTTSCAAGERFYLGAESANWRMSVFNNAEIPPI